MGQADQAEKQVRRVGRPRKAEPAVEGGDVSYAPPVVLEVVNVMPDITPSPFAQAFAKKVWDAQTPTEPRAWRLERVALAMANRGFSMEGIEL